jgi:subtilisin family serine protease
MSRTRIMRELAVVGALCAAAGTGLAAPRTPQVWRQFVQGNIQTVFNGQRKNTTWIRDANRDFVDDEIVLRFNPTGRVDIVVALNEFPGVAAAAALLDGYGGQVVHVSRLVSAVVVRGVPVSRLPEIARLPQVAMVEWAAPLRLVSDVSSRSIQARKSAVYAGHSAQEILLANGSHLDGSGETIAILDTGVDNATHHAFIGKLVAGFDAVAFQDDDGNGIDDSCEPPPTGNGSCLDVDDEPGTGTSDPVDGYGIGHGTRVASIALGAPVNGIPACTGFEAPDSSCCRQPKDDETPPDCAGIAAGAKLVDVRVCEGETCLRADVMEGLSWLGVNAKDLGVRVANLSFVEKDCLADDGTGELAQEVDALVLTGVFVVAAAGNANACGVSAGRSRVPAPASAGRGLTVAALNDLGTVTRVDDLVYNNGLVGPREDFNSAAPTVAMLKPDLSAPGYGIRGAKLGSTNGYTGDSGTSYAAPAAAGAAAIVIQARPGIDPSSLKHLLRNTADSSHNVAYDATVDPVWDQARGQGELTLWPAIETIPEVDVGFLSCEESLAILGEPCVVASPIFPWNNFADIRTETPPRPGERNAIIADIRNSGRRAATVRVSFAVAPLSTGAVDLDPFGEQTVTIPAETTVSVAQPWVPRDWGGETIGVSIIFGFDSNFGNNVTRRSFTYDPSTFEIRVENPLDVPARMELRARSGREGWDCRVETPPLVMDPFDDPARIAQARFDAPPKARPGASADCNVELWAAPVSGNDAPRLVGGVTLRTFVPEACRIVTTLEDELGAPIGGARVTFRPPSVPTNAPASARAVSVSRRARATSESDGRVTLRAAPFVLQEIVVDAPGHAVASATGRFGCGATGTRLRFGKEGLRVLSPGE